MRPRRGRHGPRRSFRRAIHLTAEPIAGPCVPQRLVVLARDALTIPCPVELFDAGVVELFDAGVVELRDVFCPQVGELFGVRHSITVQAFYQVPRLGLGRPPSGPGGRAISRDFASIPHESRCHTARARPLGDPEPPPMRPRRGRHGPRRSFRVSD